MQDLPSSCQTASQGCVRDVLCYAHRAFQRNSTASKRTQYSAKCVVLVGTIFQQFTINICEPNGNILFKGILLFLYPDPWTLVADILCPAVFV